MKLEVRCEECSSSILTQTNITKIFYCPTCDEEYCLNDLEVEVIDER